MFGGVCFMLDGKMVVGVIHDDLMVRVGKEDYAAALKRPHLRPMDFTGRPLTGFLYVAPAGIKTAKQLGNWVHRCLDYVASLPPPKRKKRPPRKPILRARGSRI